MQTTSVTTARRADERVRVKMPTAVFSHHFFAPVEVECTDLSVSGMFVAADLLLGAGERVLVAFMVPGTWHRILIDAEVVRSSEGPSPGMGLRFDRIPSFDADILRGAMYRRLAS